jgi:Protein of unknown function (DUF1552)
MIITRKHLPRRSFLRGLGAAVALPALDAMTPALAAAPKPPIRLAFVYVPNGVVNIDWWTPKGEGTTYAFPRLTKPLERFRDDILMLTGLDDHNGNALGDGPGDHGRAGASFLSGVHCKKTAGADIQAGISADQAAAQLLGARTRFASLELGCEDSRTVGNCDSGYSCAYTNSISWRTPTQPNPPEVNPRHVFERLFGTADRSLAPGVRARRAEYRKSILDLVRTDTQHLLGTLGASDKRKLDEYLHAVREIETRIASAEDANREFTPPLEKPAGIPIDFRDYARLMCDLLLLAFQTDLTRISTLMFAREGSMRVYPEIGIPDPHHPLTHHRNNADWIEKVAVINTLHVELFTYFLDKLKTAKEGDGTLLDHSMIVYGAGISDGNRHNHENLPIVLAGRGGGSLKPGRHLVYKPGKPMTNLYLALLDCMGAHPERIGDSTGRLEQLTGLQS